MLSFYQVFDDQFEQKVLLMSVSRLDYPPALGESFEINGIEFIVVHIKHKLNTATMQQDLEYYLMKSEDAYYLDFQYVEVDDETEDEEFYGDRGF